MIRPLLLWFFIDGKDKFSFLSNRVTYGIATCTCISRMLPSSIWFRPNPNVPSQSSYIHIMNWTAVHQINVYKAIIVYKWKHFYKIWGQLLSIGCEFGITTLMSDSLECSLSLRSFVYVSLYSFFGWLFIIHLKCELLYKF